MKKVLIFLSFCILILNPIKANALRVNRVTVAGENYAKEGDEINITFNVDLQNFQKAEGVWIIIYELQFDKDALVLMDVSADGFYTIFYNENNRYFVFSEVVEGSPSSCLDGQLYCGPYKTTAKFFVKDASKTSTKITMDALGIGYLDISSNKEEYTEEDLKTIETSGNSWTVGLTKSDIKVEAPKENVSTEKPSVSVKKESDKTSTAKSSLALLKSLSVENYDIKFDKYLLEYTIQINDEVKSLNIKAEPEDSKATYKIIGADDLKTNGNKVIIEVTAEDGSKKNYTINTKVTIGSKDQPTKDITKQEKTEAPKVKINKKVVNYIIYAVGGVIGIIIIGFIISKIRNRKLDKMLDQL